MAPPFVRLAAASAAGLLAAWTPAGGQTLRQVGLVPSDSSVFGQIEDVDLLPDGGVVVLDGQARALYVYSPEGRLLRTLAGPGRGPGEIALSAEVEVGPEGRVMVADAGNRRLTLWASDGSRLASRRIDDLPGAAGRWPHELIWHGSGVLLKTSGFAPEAPIRFHQVPADLAGAARLVASLPTGPDAVTCLFCPVTVDPGGALVVARGDTLYSIRRLGVDGRMTAEWSRHDRPAARRSDEELRRLRSAAQSRGRAEGGAGASGSFAAFKARFGPHTLDFDPFSRLWTLPAMEDGRPGTFDVFAPSGTLVATLTVAVPVLRFRIRGRHLVAVSETPIGEPVVRVYEIGPPDGGPP